ncbi:hypothetical protein ABIC28_001665 [Rhodococcus sp. PvR044]|uniref:hypothetical protein n=1 Tax=Rhodococcus sp. PvR044 TaxID=3156402 RepID=UPI00339542CE
MVGSLVRKGGSVLAALTVVASGITMGVGTAAGQSWWEDEVLQNLLPPCTIESMPSGGPCYERAFTDEGMAGDLHMSYAGPKDVKSGDVVSFYASSSAGEGGYQPAVPDVEVSSVTHHPPRGFEFMDATVFARKPGWYPEGSTHWALDSTVAVDPVTGNVTVTPPAGGWAVPKSREYHPNPDTTLFLSGDVTVQMRYRASGYGLDNPSGVTVTGTGVPASEGWLATGNTRVTPMGGTGSTGS